MSLYLSRFQIAQNPTADALRGLIDPHLRGQAMDAHHRLIWTAFAANPDQNRDFLWRAEGNGRFMVLSQREPVAAPLFEPHQVKPFAPDLRNGDRLDFALRVNATKDRPAKYAPTRDRRVDVVMNALHGVPQESRVGERMALAQAAGWTWLVGQGSRYGFTLKDMIVADYSVVALPAYRGPRSRQPQFGVLEISGILTVTDVTAFLPKLAQGFGRAKAFGCGLMLIRRA